MVVFQKLVGTRKLVGIGIWRVPGGQNMYGVNINVVPETLCELLKKLIKNLFA